MTTRYISVANTAKLVRQALKESFPKIKFSVRSKSYSGGASIDVSWTDGPMTAEVQKVTNRFEGATFDGMIDLKSYHTSTLNGEQVHFCANFIFCNRNYSADFLRRRADKVAQRYGGDVVQVIVRESGYVELIGGNERWSTSTFSYRDLVMKEAHKTRQV